jgi:hypothetical protein
MSPLYVRPAIGLWEPPLADPHDSPIQGRRAKLDRMVGRAAGSGGNAGPAFPLGTDE